jgi:hypothetical protein
MTPPKVPERLSGAAPAPLFTCVCLFAALSGLAALGAESPSSQPGGAAAGKVVVMSPFDVGRRPVGSFGFGIRAMKDGVTQRILEMTVDSVAPNSEASSKGLAPMTQILSIDGRDVREFTASFSKDSDPNRKLMGRKAGDRVTLEILVLGDRAPRFVTLTEGRRVLAPSFQDPDVDESSPNATHVGFSH